MPDSRTVLPAPELLNLIGVRADANSITLTARTSPRTARCPVCNAISESSLPLHEDSGRSALAGHLVAAIVMPYSQGQTEGLVNKLKLTKRQMYGRAKFDLLRQRVLYAAAA